MIELGEEAYLSPQTIAFTFFIMAEGTRVRPFHFPFNKCLFIDRRDSLLVNTQDP